MKTRLSWKPWNRQSRTKAIFAAAPLVVLLTVTASSATRAALTPGEDAPDFALPTLTGQTIRYDAAVSTPTLFLSLKPRERYTTQTLDVLRATFGKFPQLKNGLNRWIVISRYEEKSELDFLDGLPLQGWTVILDPDDVFYKEYKIIATPTITLVGKDHTVAAVHPGYDPGMAQDVRLSLAKLLGVELPRTTNATAKKPNLMLQLARRLAQRGLWDRALSTYEKAKEAGPLPPEAQLEMAEIYLKIEKPEKALEILKNVPADQVDAARLEGIRERARQQEKPKAPPSEPPKVYR